MKTKVIALVMTIVLVMSSLSGCEFDLPKLPGKTTALTLSPENTSVTTADGITVNVGNYVL